MTHTAQNYFDALNFTTSRSQSDPDRLELFFPLRSLDDTEIKVINQSLLLAHKIQPNQLDWRDNQTLWIHSIPIGVLD